MSSAKTVMDCTDAAACQRMVKVISQLHCCIVQSHMHTHAHSTHTHIYTPHTHAHTTHIHTLTTHTHIHTPHTHAHTHISHTHIHIPHTLHTHMYTHHTHTCTHTHPHTHTHTQLCLNYMAIVMWRSADVASESTSGTTVWLDGTATSLVCQLTLHTYTTSIVCVCSAVNKCDDPSCRGELLDTIIHFGENLPEGI